MRVLLLTVLILVQERSGNALQCLSYGSDESVIGSNGDSCSGNAILFAQEKYYNNMIPTRNQHQIYRNSMLWLCSLIVIAMIWVSNL